MIPQYPILSSGAVKDLEKKIAELGKPSVFVGSTYERRHLAEYVKSQFDTMLFNVDCWHDGVFGPTLGRDGDTSNLEWLKNFTDIYDFGIFLFTEDDYIKNNRGFEADAVRHNLVFEFGLFFGRLGAKRSFIIKTDRTDEFINKFFSDIKENIGKFTGTGKNITLSIYEIPVNEIEAIERGLISKGATQNCSQVLISIQEAISKAFDTPDISFLPATTLAIGYYNNLIKDFIELMSDNPGTITKDVTKNKDMQNCLAKGEPIVLTVLLPRSPSEYNQNSISKHFNSNDYDEFVVETNRKKPVRRLKTSSESKTVMLFDIPSTMIASYESILQVNSNPDIRELLWAKELKNFKMKLEALFADSRKDIALNVGHGFDMVVKYVD